jgi:hypothetical protein
LEERAELKDSVEGAVGDVRAESWALTVQLKVKFNL